MMLASYQRHLVRISDEGESPSCSAYWDLRFRARLDFCEKVIPCVNNLEPRVRFALNPDEITQIADAVSRQWVKQIKLAQSFERVIRRSPTVHKVFARNGHHCRGTRAWPPA
jgi:hypothetical protein